jgi:molybdopterin-containing oxidoreductase family membrane subunit
MAKPAGTGGAHAAAAKYLFFGHGGHVLVPWIWSAIALNTGSAILLYVGRGKPVTTSLNVACVGAFSGVWIEKGMGLIVPGFVPSTLHEYVEYAPSLTEWKITAGIWALGLMVLTVAVKVSLPVLSGRLTLGMQVPRPSVRPEGSDPWPRASPSCRM